MTRVATAAKGCIEVDGVTGRRYRFGQDGTANMHPADAKAMVRFGGFIPSALGTTRAGLGFRCEDCGFGSWFKTCSRCGGNAEREGLGVAI